MVYAWQLSCLSLISFMLVGCGASSTPVTAHDQDTADAAGTTGPSVERQSLVVVMDADTNRFAAYDAEGQLVHDYRPLCDFGGSFKDCIASVEKEAFGWNTTIDAPYFSSVVIDRRDQEPPLRASEIYVRARHVVDDSIRLRIANAAGQVTDEFDIAGDWRSFRASPRRQYLLGDVGYQSGVVIRRSDHGVVWQGPIAYAAFTPDDQHMIVVSSRDGSALTIIELGTGRTANVELNQLPDGFKVDDEPSRFDIWAALNSGAVVTVPPANAPLAQALFWLTWDGELTPFDPTLPQEVIEYLFAANREATRLLWWRNPTSSSAAVDPSLLGWFEFDPVGREMRPMTDVSEENKFCYISTVGGYYRLDNGILRKCDCGSDACSDLVTPPAVVEPAWSADLLMSPTRGVVAVEYLWGSERDVVGTAPASLYTAQGVLITTLDVNRLEFDQLDRLAIGHSKEPAELGRYSISLSNGHISWLGSPEHAVIIYE